MKRELIKRSFDANAFLAQSAEGAAVNPEMWDMRLREYQEKNLVITGLAEQFDFRGPGVDYKVTIDNPPTAAADVAETDAIAIQANSTRNVVFDPTERGSGFEVSTKELVRSFFNVMERFSKKLGYSLAQRKDAFALSVVYDAVPAAHAIVANNVASSAITSDDTMNYASITSAKRVIEKKLYRPEVLLVNVSQEEQLLNLGTIHKADEFGTRAAIERGVIGSLFGLLVVKSDSIPITDNKSKAIVMGTTKSGERALGYAIKRDPVMEMERDVKLRRTILVAHEDYDFKVLHADALATIETYAA